MKMMDHCNVVQLKHCFYTTTEKDEVFLNLVLEFVPETVYRIGKHYSKNGQRMPTLFVKLYVYQVRAQFGPVRCMFALCKVNVHKHCLVVTTLAICCDGCLLHVCLFCQVHDYQVRCISTSQDACLSGKVHVYQVRCMSPR